jgi:hypothetical protein
MFTEEILKKLENDDLPTKIARVEALMAQNENPGALEMGILLSLRMGLEMQEGKALGTDSAELVVGWMDKYPHELVEEAISHARALLLKNTEIVDKVRRHVLDESSDALDGEDEAS